VDAGIQIEGLQEVAHHGGTSLVRQQVLLLPFGKG
jgi:hypothetical protein